VDPITRATSYRARPTSDPTRAVTTPRKKNSADRILKLKENRDSQRTYSDGTRELYTIAKKLWRKHTRIGQTLWSDLIIPSIYIYMHPL
jgi:hypothetical protein